MKKHFETAAETGGRSWKMTRSPESGKSMVYDFADNCIP